MAWMPAGFAPHRRDRPKAARYWPSFCKLNVGTRIDITIRDLAERVAKIANYEGSFVYERAKPDGVPRKVMELSRLKALGWVATTSIEDGFRMAYQWYVDNVAWSARPLERRERARA